MDYPAAEWGQMWTYDNGFQVYQRIGLLKLAMISRDVLMLPIWTYYIEGNKAYIHVLRVPVEVKSV